MDGSPSCARGSATASTAGHGSCPAEAIAAPAEAIDDVRRTQRPRAALVPAAVLVPIVPAPSPGVLLTKRTAASVRPCRAGELSRRPDRPGRRQPEAAALREAEEEIGLDPGAVELRAAAGLRHRHRVPDHARAGAAAAGLELTISPARGGGGLRAAAAVLLDPAAPQRRRARVPRARGASSGSGRIRSTTSGARRRHPGASGAPAARAERALHDAAGRAAALFLAPFARLSRSGARARGAAAGPSPPMLALTLLRPGAVRRRRWSGSGLHRALAPDSPYVPAQVRGRANRAGPRRRERRAGAASCLRPSWRPGAAGGARRAAARRGWSAAACATRWPGGRSPISTSRRPTRPEQVDAPRCAAAGLRAVPTGLDHGTVTAVSGGIAASR